MVTRCALLVVGHAGGVAAVPVLSPKRNRTRETWSDTLAASVARSTTRKRLAGAAASSGLSDGSGETAGGTGPLLLKYCIQP